MGLFKFVTPIEKFNLYKVADRSAQLIAIKNLYFKPSFVSKLSFYELYLFKDYLLVNYLFKMLFQID